MNPTSQPVELVRDGTRDRFKLTLRPDDLITNVSLQAWLKEQFGILLPDLPDADDWTPSSYFAAVQEAIATDQHGLHGSRAPAADTRG